MCYLLCTENLAVIKMESMQMDLGSENKNFKDIEIDDHSFEPNKKIKLTKEGEYYEHPPVVSTKEDMFEYLEYHEDEPRFIMEIIHKSTLDFTEYQKELIKKMEGEFTAWVISNETRDIDDFINFVDELKYDIVSEHEMVDPNFCEEQLLKYAYVHKTFEKSMFPYSSKQREMLRELKEIIEHATGNLSNMADICLLENFQEFFNTIKAREHIGSGRFFIDCTVDFYVQDIVDEFYYGEWDEATRIIPEYFSDEPMANLVTYAKKELQLAYNGVHYHQRNNLFHLGLSEVYYQLVDTFRYSGLTTENQKGYYHRILKDIGKAVRTHNTYDYHDIHLGFYGLLDSLRHNHVERETKVEDSYMSTDEDGKISKEVKRVAALLIEVEDAEKIHHESFSEYASPIPEITNRIYVYFRRIYPENFGRPMEGY